jgi:hypothetical protein
MSGGGCFRSGAGAPGAAAGVLGAADLSGGERRIGGGEPPEGASGAAAKPAAGISRIAAQSSARLTGEFVIRDGFFDRRGRRRDVPRGEQGEAGGDGQQKHRNEHEHEFFHWTV